MKRVTIKDIASLAGVSTATVSRVINDNEFVEESFRKKVEAAISRLGYVPNAAARSLKSDSSRMIGYIVSDISNNYFTSLAYHLETVIKREKFNIMIFSSNQDRERELAYLKLLQSNQADGLVINSSGHNDDYIAAFSKSIPTVSLSRKIQNPGFLGDFIDSNNYEGGYKLAHHLIAYGHRRIGVINGNTKLSTGMERYNGFLAALEEARIKIPVQYAYQGDFTWESGYEGCRQLLALDERPTAVIAMNNNMALGAMQYLLDNNIPVPDQISLASYGDINMLSLLRIQPSLVSLNPQIIGIKCGELILSRIKDNSMAQREIIYEPKLSVGSAVSRPLDGNVAPASARDAYGSKASSAIS